MKADSPPLGLTGDLGRGRSSPAAETAVSADPFERGSPPCNPPLIGAITATVNG